MPAKDVLKYDADGRLVSVNLDIRYDRIRVFNAVNLKEDYPPIDIRSHPVAALTLPAKVAHKVVQQVRRSDCNEGKASDENRVFDYLQTSATWCSLEVIKSSGPLGLEPRTS